MKRTSAIFFTFFLILLSLNAQNTLQSKYNMFRAGDQIIKQQIEYISPGQSGASVIWDFSKVSIVNEEYPLFFYREQADDLTQIIAWEHETRFL